MEEIKKIFVLDENRIKLGAKAKDELFCLDFYMASRFKEKEKITAESLDDLLNKLKEKFLLLADINENIYENFIEKYNNGVYDGNFFGSK